MVARFVFMRFVVVGLSETQSLCQKTSKNPRGLTKSIVDETTARKISMIRRVFVNFQKAMPQLKKPMTLYDIALLKTRSWIVQVATVIYKTTGDFDNVQCRQAVSKFNQYLTTSVPTRIIDELYNSPELFNLEITELQCLMCGNGCSSFHTLCSVQNQKLDLRIVLSLYLHENMKVLTAHKAAQDFFWKQTLPTLHNLVRLDLNKVCTDEILEVVGDHCRNLEFVNIVSKSCLTRTRDRHNALKLQLCVSDAGLKCLSNCKQLIEIQMTCIIRKGCGGRQITNEGIKHLLLSLPKLRRINYTDTGVLLDSMSDNDRLCLVSITDYHPCASRIPRMELLCPCLTELHLTFAYSTEDYRSNVITALAFSGLKISVLSLTNFLCDDILKQYLELKGTHLKVLNILSNHIQSMNELILLLGWTCPNLEALHMHFQNVLAWNNTLPFVNSSSNNENWFCNLESLVIKGIAWESNKILPLLLKNAKNIKKIILDTASVYGHLDVALGNVMLVNRLSRLEHVSFLKGTGISFKFLKTFLRFCPVLSNVVIETSSQTYFKLVELLQRDLIRNNVDVNIDVCKINY